MSGIVGKRGGIFTVEAEIPSSFYHNKNDRTGKEGGSSKRVTTGDRESKVR